MVKEDRVGYLACRRYIIDDMKPTGGGKTANLSAG
jgi:hypothetical protein